MSVLSGSLSARQLHLSAMLQHTIQLRRWFLRHGSVGRRLPVELLLGERYLRAIETRRPESVSWVPRRNEHLLRRRIVLVLDHLVDLVEVWVLRMAALPWLEHLVLGQWLTCLVDLLFDLLETLELLPHISLLDDTSVAWLLVCLIWLEECRDVVLSVRVDVVRGQTLRLQKPGGLRVSQRLLCILT